jgi:hypothetical protein
MASGLARCDPCGARITFITIRKRDGKPARMVLNHAPDPAGNVAVRQVSGKPLGRVLTKGQQPDPDEQLYMPHHATCPKASQWRRPKVKAAAAQAARAVNPQPDLFTTEATWPAST